jgi:hypothetical protein
MTVFDSSTATSHGLGLHQGVAPAASATNAIATMHGLNGNGPLAAVGTLGAAGFNGLLAPSSSPNGYAGSSPVGRTTLASPSITATRTIQIGTPSSAFPLTRIATNRLSSPWSVVRGQRSAPGGQVGAETDWEYAIAVSPTASRDHDRLVPTGRQIGIVLDSALEELASDSVLLRGYEDGGGLTDLAAGSAGVAKDSVLVNMTPQEDSDGSTTRLSGLFMAGGFVGLGAGLLAARKPKDQNGSPQRRRFQFRPRVR